MHPVSKLPPTSPVTKSVSSSEERNGHVPLSGKGAESDRKDMRDFAALFGELPAETPTDGPTTESLEEEVEVVLSEDDFADKQQPTDSETELYVRLSEITQAPPKLLENAVAQENGSASMANETVGEPAITLSKEERFAVSNLSATPQPAKSKPENVNVKQAIAAFAVDQRMVGHIRLEASQRQISVPSPAEGDSKTPRIADTVTTPEKTIVQIPVGKFAKEMPEQSERGQFIKTGDLPAVANGAVTTPFQATMPERSNASTALRRLGSIDEAARDRKYPLLPVTAAPPAQKAVQPMLASGPAIALLPHRSAEPSLTPTVDAPLELFGDPARALGPLTPAMLSRPELPAQVARQMVEVMQQQQNRPVELALNPVELGRVRMSIVAEDGGIIVHVLAERSETLDLLRRNIAQLGEEFKSLGYESIAFSFGEGSTGTSERDSGPNSEGSAALDLIEAPEATPIPQNMAAQSGVDIRL